MADCARITLRLDFGPGSRLGHGKIALLEAIRRRGSISAAGREFGMSYRRAWLLVDEVNRMFREPLVRAKGGGRGGGGAVLTDAGERVVGLYREVERKTMTQATHELDGIVGMLAPGERPRADRPPSMPKGGRRGRVDGAQIPGQRVADAAG